MKALILTLALTSVQSFAATVYLKKPAVSGTVEGVAFVTKDLKDQTECQQSTLEAMDSLVRDGFKVFSAECTDTTRASGGRGQTEDYTYSLIKFL